MQQKGSFIVGSIVRGIIIESRGIEEFGYGHVECVCDLYERFNARIFRAAFDDAIQRGGAETAHGG